MARVAANYGSVSLELVVYLAGQGGTMQARGNLTMWPGFVAPHASGKRLPDRSGTASVQVTGFPVS